MFRSCALALVLFATPVAALAGDLAPSAAGEVLDQFKAGMRTYFDPAVAAKVEAMLEANRGKYVSLGDRQAFAAAVTADLYAATRDKHLKLSVQTADASKSAQVTDADQAQIDRMLAYGLVSVRRLPANIGYINLSYLDQTEAGAALVDSLMQLVKDTDALILDLRQNRGGGGATDEELLGHLSRTPMPMEKITWRNADGTTSVTARTARSPVGGPLYADKPVYVLTSQVTFSAAEALAYNLQATRRATIVGEVTAGGANPSNRGVRVGYGFRAGIPNGKVEHPITRSNWEGVGVQPDVVTAPDAALTAAYARALAAAKPAIVTPKSAAERARAVADPRGVLAADQPL